MPELRRMRAAVPCAAPPTKPFMALLIEPRSVKADTRFPRCSCPLCLSCCSAQRPELLLTRPIRALIFPIPTAEAAVSARCSKQHLLGSQPRASCICRGKETPRTGDCSWLLGDSPPKPSHTERPHIAGEPSPRPGGAPRTAVCLDRKGRCSAGCHPRVLLKALAVSSETVDQ